MKEKKKIEIPALTQLEAELERENRKRQYRGELGKMAGILIVIGCALALVADMMLPVLQVNGTSMSPTLRKGDIVISMRGAEFTRGDMVAFYHSDKILVKRVIGLSEEWIDMNSDGDVYIDGVLLQEPYLGNAILSFPTRFPKERCLLWEITEAYRRTAVAAG